MNKTILVLGGMGLVGFLGYMFLRRQNNEVTGMQAIEKAGTAQPSQLYPLQNPANSTQRQDNKSQPWYGGSQVFNEKQFLGINVGDIGAAADAIGSLKSIWEDLDVGSWFSSGGDEFSLDQYAFDDVDTGGGWNWDDLSAGSSSYNFSNVA